MNHPSVILLVVLISQIAYILGEILLKAAMNHTHAARIPWPVFLPRFVAGCAGIGGSFLLWLALLSERPLSYLFPFQSLNAVVIALGAAIFLRERLTARLAISLLLVTIGVGLVVTS